MTGAPWLTTARWARWHQCIISVVIHNCAAHQRLPSVFIHSKAFQAIMMTAMSHTSAIRSRVQLSVVGSQRRSALSCNPVSSARRSVVRHVGEGSGPQDPAGPRGETTEQIRDVQEPNIDQSKTENIQPGNISNENAERRADIGATRPPTLFGKKPCWLVSFPAFLRTFPCDTSSL